MGGVRGAVRTLFFLNCLMIMPNPTILKGRIYQVIHEHGPMIYDRIAQYMLDVSVTNIKACINEDRRKRIKKIFRVVDWHRNIGVRGQPSPVIGLGSEADVAAPDFTDQHKLAQRRYNKKRTIKKDTTLTEENRQEQIKAIEQAQSDEINVGHVSALVFANMIHPSPPIQIQSTPVRRHRTPDKEKQTPTSNS